MGLSLGSPIRGERTASGLMVLPTSTYRPDTTPAPNLKEPASDSSKASKERSA